MSYSIDQDQGITYVRFNTSPSVEEITAVGETLSHMQDAAKRFWFFEQGVEFSADEVRLIAQEADGMAFGRSWVAIVADRNLTYGLSRMYAVFRTVEAVTVKVFHSEAEALVWLHAQGNN